MSKINQFKFILTGLFLLFNANLCFGDAILIFANHSKPPKVFLENKIPKGILVEIMRYVDQNLPQSFEYHFYPWKRAYQNALDGKGGVIGFSKNSERLKVFDYSVVMYHEELLLVVLKGNEFSYNSMQDLKGKKVGSLRGASFGEEFEIGKKNVFEIDEDDNLEQRLLKLLRKRIDVALIGPGRIGV